MSDCCVYTTLLGPYETLNDQPPAAKSDVDFICFTDNLELKSETWQMRYVSPVLPMDAARSSRLYKICPHRFLDGYRSSLYVDNSIVLKQTPEQIFSELEEYQADLVCIYHSYRETILDEFVEVLNLELDSPNIILEQLNAYSLICPELLQERPYWGGFIYRNHHDEQATAAMETWLVQVLRYARRDQLSFNYALAQHAVRTCALELDNFNNKYLTWPHVVQRQRDTYKRTGLLSTTSAVALQKIAENELKQNAEELTRTGAELEQKDKLLQEIYSSRAWRMIQPLRRIWLRIKLMRRKDSA